MKKYVITIMNNPHSVEAAERCIESAKKFGYEVEMFPAITPANDVYRMFDYFEFPTDAFDNNPYSRTEPTMACFLSHHALWCVANSLDESILILEHDAVFTSELPDVEIDTLVTFGKPSFGNFQTANAEGLYPLFSKGGSYLGGAHAYAVSAKGARELISSAMKDAKPTDVFIGNNSVLGAKEYYPWPVVVNDSVSTVQKELGCRAKHNRVVPV